MPAMVKWIVLPLQFTSLSFFFSFDLSSCCAWPLSQKSVYARFFSSNHKVQFKILTNFSEISSNQEWTNSMRSRIFSNSLNTVDIWQRDSLPQTLPQSWWRLAVFTWRFFCAPWFHDIFFHDIVFFTGLRDCCFEFLTPKLMKDLREFSQYLLWFLSLTIWKIVIVLFMVTLF